MNTLQAGSYWKWRNKIEEMKHAETKIKAAQLMNSLMEKDVEILKLRAAIYKQTIKSHEDSHADLKKQYEEIKLELETEIGGSLNNCVIDDHTFEVKKLEDDLPNS
jgi:hypothetical protein